MKLFIDTGPIVAYYNTDDSLHDAAKQVFDDLASGVLEFSAIYTSDYIFDECITVIGARTKKYDLAIQLGNAILSSEVIELIPIDDPVFKTAWQIYKVHKGSGLSFTDSSSIALMRSYDIQTIFTFDKHFLISKDINSIPMG